jgi:hypothetical protein
VSAARCGLRITRPVGLTGARGSYPAGRLDYPPYGLAGGYHRHTPATAVGSPGMDRRRRLPYGSAGRRHRLGPPPNRFSRPPVSTTTPYGLPACRESVCFRPPRPAASIGGGDDGKKVCVAPRSIRRAGVRGGPSRSTFSPPWVTCPPWLRREAARQVARVTAQRSSPLRGSVCGTVAPPRIRESLPGPIPRSALARCRWWWWVSSGLKR